MRRTSTIFLYSKVRSITGLVQFFTFLLSYPPVHIHLAFAGIVRRAVALGRFLQNPVTMVSSLCGTMKEILSLRLHPMQNSLTNEELYETIERVMVTVVNQVGSVSFSCNRAFILVLQAKLYN